MSNMINFSGQELQRHYSSKDKVLDPKEIEQQKKDMEALRKHRKRQSWRTEIREKKMEERDAERAPLPEKMLKDVDKKTEKMVESEKKYFEKVAEEKKKEVKSKTNHLARRYGLKEPNNPEALEHDRLHCFICDRRLHEPDAYKTEGLDELFDDEEVRTLCCWCFGRMSDSEVKTTCRSDKDATKEVRLAIYDPETYADTIVKEELNEKVESIHKVAKTRKMYIESKMRKYKQVLNMVGKIKHNSIDDRDQMENAVIYNAKTRYTACTL